MVVVLLVFDGLRCWVFLFAGGADPNVHGLSNSPVFSSLVMLIELSMIIDCSLYINRCQHLYELVERVRDLEFYTQVECIALIAVTAVTAVEGAARWGWIH